MRVNRREHVSKARVEQHTKPTHERVLCRRLGRPIALQDHVVCPYCYGALADVATGDHERFCDFDSDKDPCCFGFLPGSDRHLLG